MARAAGVLPRLLGAERCRGQVYNVGSDRAVTIRTFPIPSSAISWANPAGMFGSRQVNAHPNSTRKVVTPTPSRNIATVAGMSQRRSPNRMTHGQSR